jgi:hypothetical protein
MEEDPSNGKESSLSVHANGVENTRRYVYMGIYMGVILSTMYEYVGD